MQQELNLCMRVSKYSRQESENNMKIVHRISYNPSHRKKITKKLQKLGINLEKSGSKKVVLLHYFDICENDPVWPEVKEIFSASKIKACCGVSHSIKSISLTFSIRISVLDPVLLEK